MRTAPGTWNSSYSSRRRTSMSAMSPESRTRASSSMSTSAGTKSGYRQVARGVGVAQRFTVLQPHLHDREAFDRAMGRPLPLVELVAQMVEAAATVRSEERL